MFLFIKHTMKLIKKYLSEHIISYGFNVSSDDITEMEYDKDTVVYKIPFFYYDEPYVDIELYIIFKNGKILQIEVHAIYGDSKLHIKTYNGGLCEIEKILQNQDYYYNKWLKIVNSYIEDSKKLQEDVSLKQFGDIVLAYNVFQPLFNGSVKFQFSYDELVRNDIYNKDTYKFLLDYFIDYKLNEVTIDISIDNEEVMRSFIQYYGRRKATLESSNAINFGFKIEGVNDKWIENFKTGVKEFGELNVDIIYNGKYSVSIIVQRKPIIETYKKIRIKNRKDAENIVKQIYEDDSVLNNLKDFTEGLLQEKRWYFDYQK